MSQLQIGDRAPDFNLPDQTGVLKALNDYRGQWLILYFYPKDMTSGCSLEAHEFTQALPDFQKLSADVVGVSPDSVKRHVKFCEKEALSITLLSDPDHDALEPYHVWVEKKMYGRTYMGVQRSTLIIDPDGMIVKIYPKVKVKGHVQAVLEDLAQLQK